MSNRLDQEREKELQPKRMEYAKGKIMGLMLPIIEEDGTKLVFVFNGYKVTVYPYSGWFSGKSVKAGRGIDKLLKQLHS